MPPTPDDPSLPAYGPGDQLRHDLKSALTAIHGHAQLLERAIRRSRSLPTDEQARMLESLATIEAAVREMVVVIDAMARESLDHAGDGPDPPP